MLVVTGASVRTEKTLSVVPHGLSTSERFLSKNVLFVCVYTCLRVSRKPEEEGVTPSELELPVVVIYPVRLLAPNSSPLKKQQVL